MKGDQKISRRQLIRGIAGTAVGLAGLAAYGCSTAAPAATPAATAKPAQPAAAATSQPAPASTAATKPTYSTKPLVIGTVGGTWKDWQDEAVAQPLNKETGITVTWDVLASAGIVAAMVAAKKANQTPTHHLSKIDEDHYQFVDRTGLTQPVDKNVVTNWNDIHPNFRSDSWMTNHLSVFAMAWNKDKVKKPITSWFDMWDDAFKGKVAIPIFEWAGFRYLCAINHILGGTPENSDPVFNKMKEIVDRLQPKFMNSVEHGNQLFQSEEIWIAPFWDGRTRNLQDMKLPMEYIYPKEGAISNGSGFVINRDLKDGVKEANAFMQKVGDPQSQIAFCSKINYPPTNVKAKLPSNLERMAIKPEDMDRMIKADWAGYLDKKSDYLDRWNREIAAKAGG